MASPHAWVCKREGLQRQIEKAPCGSRWLPVEAFVDKRTGWIGSIVHDHVWLRPASSAATGTNPMEATWKTANSMRH